MVPLPIGFSVGALIRYNGSGPAYGAFFGPRVAGAGEVDVTKLHFRDAVLVCKFGDHGFFKERWIVIGNIPDWNSHPWPLPRFYRTHDDPELCYVSEYDDNLNLMTETIEPMANVLAWGLPYDALLGSSIVENKLAKLCDI